MLNKLAWIPGTWRSETKKDQSDDREMALVDTWKPAMPGPIFWPRDGLLGLGLVNSAGSCQGVNGGVALPPASNVVVSGRLIGCAFDASGRLQPAEQPMAGGAAHLGRHSSPSHTCSGVTQDLQQGV